MSDHALNLHYHQHSGAFEDCSRVECARARQCLPAYEVLPPQEGAEAVSAALDDGDVLAGIVRDLAALPVRLARVGPFGVSVVCEVCRSPVSGNGSVLGEHAAACVVRRAREWVEARR